MSTTMTLPGYVTAQDIANRLRVSKSRVFQIVRELNENRAEKLGYLVGTVRLFSATDAAEIESAHNEKRKYEKNPD